MTVRRLHLLRPGTGPVRRLLAGALGAALLWGCAPAGARPADAERTLTSEERSLLTHAEQVLLGRCMQERGLPYVVVPPPAVPPEEPREFPYAIDDVAWAQANGFGAPPPGGLADQRDNPNVRHVARLSPAQQDAYLEALYGSPEQHDLSVTLAGGNVVSASSRGCTAAAKGALYGDYARWFRASVVVDNLDAEVFPRVVDDPRYVGALSAWSSCMAAGGHPARDPENLRAGWAGRVDGLSAEDSRRQERELAVAEARCAQRTGLVRTARDLERGYADQVHAAHRDAIDTLRALERGALPKAREVVDTKR
jgi:hypothetical protein